MGGGEIVGGVQGVIYSSECTVNVGQWMLDSGCWKAGDMQEVVDGWLCSSGGE
jgi:hypothetical protein